MKSDRDGEKRSVPVFCRFVVVLLYYYEGYSTAEIAGLLQCRESTVTTRLFRAGRS